VQNWEHHLALKRDDDVVLPSFETLRLLVPPCTMADFDACLAMDGDPAVKKGSLRALAWARKT
jgi:hypothetical protein